MIYLASPYTDPDPLVMEKRFLRTESFTAEKLRAGYKLFSPIVYAHNMALKYDLPKDAAFWVEFNFHMLQKSSTLWIYKLPGVDQSVGVAHEKAFFECLYGTGYTVNVIPDTF